MEKSVREILTKMAKKIQDYKLTRDKYISETKPSQKQVLKIGLLNLQKSINFYTSLLNNKISGNILDITYTQEGNIKRAKLVNLTKSEVEDIFNLKSQLLHQEIKILEIKETKTFIQDS